MPRNKAPGPTAITPGRRSIMDLNELLHAHQVEVMKARASGDEESRRLHFHKVEMYAQCIRDLRAMHERGDMTSADGSSDMLVYSSYAGRGSSLTGAFSLEVQGDDNSPETIPALPSAITARVVREYRVGPYVYHDLSLALAEYERQKLGLRRDAEADE